MGRPHTQFLGPKGQATLQQEAREKDELSTPGYYPNCQRRGQYGWFAGCRSAGMKRRGRFAAHKTTCRLGAVASKDTPASGTERNDVIGLGSHAGHLHAR